MAVRRSTQLYPDPSKVYPCWQTAYRRRDCTRNDPRCRFKGERGWVGGCWQEVGAETAGENCRGVQIQKSKQSSSSGSEEEPSAVRSCRNWILGSSSRPTRQVDAAKRSYSLQPCEKKRKKCTPSQATRHHYLDPSSNLDCCRTGSRVRLGSTARRRVGTHDLVDDAGVGER